MYEAVQLILVILVNGYSRKRFKHSFSLLNNYKYKMERVYLNYLVIFFSEDGNQKDGHPVHLTQ